MLKSQFPLRLWTFDLHPPVMVSAAPTLGWCYHPDRCHSSPHFARWGWHWNFTNRKLENSWENRGQAWLSDKHGDMHTTGKQVQETMGGHDTYWRSWTILEETENVPLELKKHDFQMMLMIKRATFGMCCFPLCIVNAPTTRSMHPVCMYIQYVYTLSIYICIYIYIYIY